MAVVVASVHIHRWIVDRFFNSDTFGGAGGKLSKEAPVSW
jgi:hypothetical protein